MTSRKAYLVIGSGHDPRAFMVKVHSSNVVQMADERKQTPSQFEVEHLDLIIITPRNKQRLRRVEVHASHRSLVLVVTVDEGADTNVPQLDRAIMQACQNPRPGRMERDPLNAVALTLKLDQHRGGGRARGRETAAGASLGSGAPGTGLSQVRIRL